MSKTKCPTDEEITAAVEKIIAAVHGSIAEFKAVAPAVVQSLSDDEWAKLKGDENRRRRKTRERTPKGIIADNMSGLKRSGTTRLSGSTTRTRKRCAPSPSVNAPQSRNWSARS
jgi:hypothetical protein